MELLFSFDTFNPEFKKTKKRETDKRRTSMAVMSKISGKYYHLKLDAEEEMRTPVNTKTMRLINNMVDETPSVKIGLHQSAESLFSQPFNITMVKNEINNGSNGGGEKKNNKKKKKNNNKNEGENIFYNTQDRDKKKDTVEDGVGAATSENNESIDSLNNDIKLDVVTSEVMKKYWLPALRQIKLNVDKYGFSPLYFLEKPIPITTYVQTQESKISSGDISINSNTNTNTTRDATNSHERTSKRQKLNEADVATTDAVDDGTHSKSIVQRDKTSDMKFNTNDTGGVPTKYADDYHVWDKFPKNTFINNQNKEKDTAHMVSEITKDAVLVNGDVPTSWGVSIPRDENGSITHTMMSRPNGELTLGNLIETTSGMRSPIIQQTIPNTYMGGRKSSDVEMQNRIEADAIERASSGEHSNTNEEYLKKMKKLDMMPGVVPNDIKVVDSTVSQINKDGISISSTAINNQSNSKSNVTTTNHTEKEQSQPASKSTKAESPVTSTSRVGGKSKREAFEGVHIMRKTTYVNHNIPSVPPMSLGSIETYWTMDGQHLVWTWKTKDKKGGLIEPLMMWVVGDMPTLDGEIRSAMAILLGDYADVKLNESRLNDIKTASMNPLYSIEKTEGKTKDSTKSGLDGDYYTSLMNPNYKGPVSTSAGEGLEEYGERLRGMMRADDVDGHNYWDTGSLASRDGQEGEKPLASAMADYLNGRGPKPPNWIGTDEENQIRNMMRSNMMQRDRPSSSIFSRPVVQNQFGSFMRLGFNEKVTRIDQPIQYSTADLEAAKKRLDISAGLATGRPLGSLLTPHEKGSGGNVFTSKASDLSNAPQYGLGVATNSRSPITEFTFAYSNRMKIIYSELIQKMFKIAYRDAYKKQEDWYKNILEKTFTETPAKIKGVLGNVNGGSIPSFESLFSITVTMPPAGNMDMTQLLELWRFGLIDTEAFVLNIPDSYPAFEKPENHLQLKKSNSGKSSGGSFDELVKRVDKQLIDALAFEKKKLKDKPEAPSIKSPAANKKKPVSSSSSATSSKSTPTKTSTK